MMRKGLLLAIFWITPSALADFACWSPPCNLKKQNGPAQCESKADWIVEGRILDVTSKYGTLCGTNVGCNTVWKESTIALESGDLLITKGSIERDKKNSIVEVHSASHCWLETSLVEPSRAGTRVRFYGLNERYPPWIRPGYFAFEFVPPKIDESSSSEEAKFNSFRSGKSTAAEVESELGESTEVDRDLPDGRFIYIYKVPNGRVSYYFNSAGTFMYMRHET